MSSTVHLLGSFLNSTVLVKNLLLVRLHFFFIFATKCSQTVQNVILHCGRSFSFFKDEVWVKNVLMS